jgi:hypothetical protein
MAYEGPLLINSRIAPEPGAEVPTAGSVPTTYPFGIVGDLTKY